MRFSTDGNGETFWAPLGLLVIYGVISRNSFAYRFVMDSGSDYNDIVADFFVVLSPWDVAVI